MNRLLLRCIAALLLSSGTIFAQQNAPSTQPMPIPTMDDLHEMYNAGDYRTCLQQISRVMRLRNGMEKNYNQVELQLLRGEALLAQNDPASAKRSFAIVGKSDDLKLAGEANALIELIQNSRGGQFVPKSGGAPISIADPKTRSEALSAMVADEFPVLQADADKALRADNLAPLLPLVPRLLSVHAAEVLATGDEQQTGPLAQRLGEHARDLMKRELDIQMQRVQAIENVANQVIDTGGGFRGGRSWWSGGGTRQGLTSPQRDDLYDLIDYLSKIQDTAAAGQHIARSMNKDSSKWDAIVTQAIQVKTRAQGVLDAEGIHTGND